MRLIATACPNSHLPVLLPACLRQALHSYETLKPLKPNVTVWVTYLGLCGLEGGGSCGGASLDDLGAGVGRNGDVALRAVLDVAVDDLARALVEELGAWQALVLLHLQPVDHTTAKSRGTIMSKCKGRCSAGTTSTR